jgi:uncharacterized membrane protein YraQ (UPF0718 family)
LVDKCIAQYRWVNISGESEPCQLKKLAAPVTAQTDLAVTGIGFGNGRFMVCGVAAITKSGRLADVHRHRPATKQPIGRIAQFLFYDVPKIPMLLAGMIFLVTIVRSFFKPEQTRATLGGKREGIGNVLTAGLGVVTPFCSCSAVPLFIGFVESGIPLGVTFSFLIATPVVNEIALAMLFGLFG